MDTGVAVYCWPRVRLPTRAAMSSSGMSSARTSPPAAVAVTPAAVRTGGQVFGSGNMVGRVGSGVWGLRLR
jgi:hypothetical protein